MSTVGTAVDSDSRATALEAPLLPGQILVLIVIGVVYWFLAAIAIRLLSPYGFLGPLNSAIAFLLAYPLGWAGVWLARLVAGLSPRQVVPGIAVGGWAATTCDGIALTWCSPLYGTAPEQILLGAAWILWGVGAFLAAAFFEARRARH